MTVTNRYLLFSETQTETIQTEEISNESTDKNLLSDLFYLLFNVAINNIFVRLLEMELQFTSLQEDFLRIKQASFYQELHNKGVYVTGNILTNMLTTLLLILVIIPDIKIPWT